MSAEAFKGLKYIVAGCGFSGAVIAERIANVLGETVLVVDEKTHIGGHSWSETDSGTGIECHKYGSHIFHTSNRKVWEYITQFGSFTGYRHKVLTMHKQRVYSMPINLQTINSYFGLTLTPSGAEEFIRREIASSGITTPRNLEEKAISQIGSSLYNAFIKNYTRKQWGRDPVELPEDIINRLPVRLSYNADYFSDLWQGVPEKGYFSLFRAMLNSPRIEVMTQVKFEEIKQYVPEDCKIIYTGMIDRYFDFCCGELEWRSLDFQWETVDVQDFQGTTVMNYADADTAFTRIHEFKHYHPERTEVFNLNKSIICREYPADYSRGKAAYYPVNSARNTGVYNAYVIEAQKHKNLILAGRLGTYRYMDMDKTIAQALEIFEDKLM